MIEPVLVDDDKLSKEQLEELAQTIATFNYDYQHIDQYSSWLAWHTLKAETDAILRRMRFIDKLAILYRVADIRDDRVERYGYFQKWDHDEEFRKKVLEFMGEGMKEARVIR